MQLLEKCDTDDNVDKVDRPPMLTETTMLMKLTGSPAVRTSSSVVGGDWEGWGGWGGIEDPVGLGSPPPPAQILYPATLIRACFTFVFFTACSRAPSLNNVCPMQGCIAYTWQLERGHKRSICSIIGVCVYVAGRWAGLVMSYRLVSPHYTTTKAKSGGKRSKTRRKKGGE